MKKLNFVVLLILSATASIAQTEKIETDRPGFTLTPISTPKKILQTEIGFFRQSEKITNTHNEIFVQHPALLTKYGIGERFELRMILDLVTIKDKTVNSSPSLTGINNLQLGGKLNFLKGKGIIPNTSLVAHYRFNKFRLVTARPDSIDGANFRFAMQHTVTENFFIGYNIGMEWESFRSKPAYIYTISPKFNFAENWQAFLEFYGYAWKNRTPKNSIDGGISYFIKDNFKIDASAGFGLNKNAPNKFYALGVSYRFKVAK